MSCQLPYLRTPEALSSTALLEYERSPELFYLKRLGPKETRPPRQATSYPMACGLAFDSLVKKALAREEELKCRDSLSQLDGFELREEALEQGERWFTAYKACGAYASLKRLGVKALDVNPGVVACPGTTSKLDPEGVPLRGELDFLVTGDVIGDWKTTGVARNGGSVPKAGYTALFDTREPGVSLGPHPKRKRLEQISDRWATQASVYRFLLGYQPEDCWVCWDLLCPWPDKKGELTELRVARYQVPLSAAYQSQVRGRLKDLWAAIEERRVVTADWAMAASPEELRVLL